MPAACAFYEDVHRSYVRDSDHPAHGLRHLAGFSRIETGRLVARLAARAARFGRPVPQF